MKKILFALATLICLQSCSHYYAYNLQLTEPEPSTPPLYYENDSMSVKFNFIPEGVKFTIQNKLTDGIKINWDEVSLSVNSKAYRVIHKETGMTKVNDLQPPTTIPPRSQLQDLIVPSEKVRFVKIYGSYSPVYGAIFPNRASYQNPDDEILSKKGQQVVVYMPFRIADKYVAKTFYFTITDVYRTKGNKYQIERL